MKKVRKAVIPVAGLGTRFLPATKAMPKEMLTIVDRPVVQYAVDEALEAGIEHIVFVTGRNKHVIEDYFDVQPELLDTLTRSGKLEQLASLNRSAAAGRHDQLHPAAGAARPRPCGVVRARHHRRRTFRAAFARHGFVRRQGLPRRRDGALRAAPAAMCWPSSNATRSRRTDTASSARASSIGSGFAITEMVEKPAPAAAPSNYYINGRYILQPEIFDILGTQERGAGNEIQLTDAMLRLSQEQAFFAAPVRGTHVRLRLEGGLHPGQRGLRAGPRRHTRPGVRADRGDDRFADAAAAKRPDRD